MLPLAALGFAAILSAETLPGAAPFAPGIAASLRDSWDARPAGYVARTRHRKPDGSPRFTNRLLLESSPYLLQHAHNPVNWYPWGDEAFAEARRRGRPVLLSIGYSTCHWCHVMEEESFEDLEIARLLNEAYVAIKVDREERPDLDAVYMSAVLAFTGRGGWPMTVWLTPDREPFFGGTYFPPRDGDRGVSLGFASLLRQLQHALTEEGSRVAATTAKLVAQMREAASLPGGGGLPDAALLHRAASAVKANYDEEGGGVRGPTKFPSSLPIRFLLRYHRRTGDRLALEMATHTLEKMAEGGIHDQLGGGFHRYTVDPQWRIPHFEKMLYDNALLAVAYLEGYQATGQDDFADVARRILSYVERDLTSPEGAFYSATDADSLAPDGQRQEGRFFTWTPAEIRSVVGDVRAHLVEAAFGVTAAGNLEGRSVLFLPSPSVEITGTPGHRDATTESALADARALLLAARSRRPPPLRDEKILAAWNGLMISALARAASTLGDPRYAMQAARAAQFVLSRMREDGRLLRTYAGGKARHDAYLEDYAFMIAGLLDLYEASPEPRWLEEAIALHRVLERHYEDSAGGAFFTTSDDHERLLTRAKPVLDGAEPSGNSVAALNLLRLYELTDDDRYRRRAERTLRTLAGGLARAPEAFPDLLVASDFQLDLPKQIVIVAPSSRAQAEPLLARLRRAFVPNRVLAVAAEGADLDGLSRLVPLLDGKIARGGQATAYVCERRVCDRPTSDPEVFAKQLAKTEPLSPSPVEDRALSYLMREVPGWRQKHACGSCHNNGDGARALYRAKRLGYPVPAASLANTADWLATPRAWEEQAGEPGTSDKKLARIQFAGALVEAREAGLSLDQGVLMQVATALARDQDPDGAWRIAQQTSIGSPVAYGPAVATWQAARTLAAADPVGFAREAAKAEAFFVAKPPQNVMDAAATALALADATSEPARTRRREAIELLVLAQGSEGGFGPYRDSAPEPFDTALAILALARTSDEANAGRVERGRDYLARTQLEEGGWRETTRPAGYQSYAQHISTTAWATLALMETAKPRRWGRGRPGPP